MSYHIEKTNLPGVLLIKNDFFEDFRGQYFELYNKRKFDLLFKDKSLNFIEDDISITEHHCLKGIHGDTETWKLISCLYGKFYLVVINYDEKSDFFGKWQSFTLSDVNKIQVLVPPMHGNGHVCLSDKSIFHYKQTNYYDLSKQFTISYNDKRFNIFWPIENPIISLRDKMCDKSFVGK